MSHNSLTELRNELAVRLEAGEIDIWSEPAETWFDDVDATASLPHRLLGFNFQQKDLNGAVLSGLDMRHAVFDGCSLEGADLTFSSLRHSSLRAVLAICSDFCAADLSWSNVDNSDFNDASFVSSKLTRASARSSSFARADLTNAVFCGADLRNANFVEADLTGADFVCANLEGADFADARLSQTNFAFSDVSGTNLNPTAVTNANFYRVRKNGKTITQWPIQRNQSRFYDWTRMLVHRSLDLTRKVAPV